MKIRASAQIRPLLCTVKDIVFKRGVKCVKDRVKEFGMQEIRGKYVMCRFD